MFDPELYAANIRALNQKELAERSVRLAKARAEADRLALKIKEGVPGVTEVYLFGSVATGDVSSSDFDIDLALDGGDVYAAMDIVLDSEFEVDLVNLSLVPQTVRERIMSLGITVPVTL